ncbi:sugar ABC transporter substrate-binding protein [Paenibacillus sp. CCS19]|uniref:ABC transporter substrate-binding protein n=1 Tax=Paenibacillus sp. CCS19 TaxID=3158387 RepID=UPI00256E1E47|nr:sugar ABC transporter substrate-binding protein [Paenibacillus cellulosilyticus]GMK37288.1 sugar ABC transporter substrate-binding protein [Paenibacillus cellulosilyticus]
MKSKKRIMAFGISVLLASTLAACGTTDQSTSKGSGGSSSAVTLNFMAWGNGPEELKGDKAIIDEFMKQNPTVKVNILTAPYGQYSDKLVTMAAGNNLPDVFWVGDKIPDFAEKGLLMPLDDLIMKNNIDLDDWLPGGTDIGRWRDKTFGFPRDLINIHVAYNKDMFDKAQVPYPNDDWTWNDFLAVAQKLTIKDSNGKVTQFGIASYYRDEAIVQNGGLSFDFDGQSPVVMFDKPEAIEAIQFVADLTNKYHVQPSAAESKGIGNLFTAQKAAMTFGGPWDWSNFAQNAKFKWDIVQVPAGKAGNKSQLLGLPIGISSKTKHQEEAWKLLEFLTHGGGQDIQSNLVGAHPSIKRTQETFNSGQYVPGNVKVVNESMQSNTIFVKSFPQLQEARTMLQPILDQIDQGKVQAADALPKIADEIRNKLNFK